MFIFVFEEDAFDNIQHPVILKALHKTGIGVYHFLHDYIGKHK